MRPEDLIITKEGDKPKSVVVIAFDKDDDSEQAMEWKVQKSLYLSYVFECCKTHIPHLLAWGEQERSDLKKSLTWVK